MTCVSQSWGGLGEACPEPIVESGHRLKRVHKDHNARRFDARQSVTCGVVSDVCRSKDICTCILLVLFLGRLGGLPLTLLACSDLVVQLLAPCEL